MKLYVYFLYFFARIGRKILPKELEKVGPFECDELEKHCRVSAKCDPTEVPALYTMAKHKFNAVWLVLLLVSRLSKSQLLVILAKNRFEKSAFFVKIEFSRIFANVAKSANVCQISKFSSR